MQNVIFHNNINVLDTVTFNTDTAGVATVAKGTSGVDVTFSQPYANPPVVRVSYVAGSTYIPDAQQAYVGGVTQNGFHIVLPGVASDDFTYNWSAIAVSGMKTTRSLPVVLGETATPSAMTQTGGQAATPSATP